MIELLFLGTSSMVPTKERGHSSILLTYKDKKILVDCGEGTQRQLKVAGESLQKINKILITHWHGDHVLGLPGIIQSIAAGGYEGKLEIYGPKGTKQRFKHMFKAFEFDKVIDMEVVEISSGTFFENDEFQLNALPLKHSIVCLGFCFQERDKIKINIKKAASYGLKEGPLLGKLQKGLEIVHEGKKIGPEQVGEVIKGKKISFVSDTGVCKNANLLAKGADLLVCESTYTSDLEEKAKEYSHMTARQAASLANISHTHRLVLTHISARYKETSGIEKEAKEIFDNVQCAYDFMRVKI